MRLPVPPECGRRTPIPTGLAPPAHVARATCGRWACSCIAGRAWKRGLAGFLPAKTDMTDLWTARTGVAFGLEADAVCSLSTYLLVYLNVPLLEALACVNQASHFKDMGFLASSRARPWVRRRQRVEEEQRIAKAAAAKVAQARQSDKWSKHMQTSSHIIELRRISVWKHNANSCSITIIVIRNKKRLTIYIYIIYTLYILYLCRINF